LRIDRNRHAALNVLGAGTHHSIYCNCGGDAAVGVRCISQRGPAPLPNRITIGRTRRGGTTGAHGTTATLPPWWQRILSYNVLCSPSLPITAFIASTVMPRNLAAAATGGIYHTFATTYGQRYRAGKTAVLYVTLAVRSCDDVARIRCARVARAALTPSSDATFLRCGNTGMA